MSILIYVFCVFQALSGVVRRARLYGRNADIKRRRDGSVLRRSVHVRDTREGSQRGGGRAHVAHHHTHQGGPREVQGVTDHRPYRLRRR